MFWTDKELYNPAPFEKEKDLEAAIQEVKADLFGPTRIYLETKKRIGQKGKLQNIPDAYLLDLSSKTMPRLFVVEVELASHHPTKHIAVQLLEFSLSFESSKQKVKEVVKECLTSDEATKKKAENYANANGFENLDFLLERAVHRERAFHAMVIIDQTSEVLEAALLSQFQFPVEIITLSRFQTADAVMGYLFEPFMQDLAQVALGEGSTDLDPEMIDCIVVPANEEGFTEVFLGENRWYQIRINSSMIPKIQWIAGYQTVPISAITHVAKVHSIELWDGGPKYVLNFEGPAEKIKPLKRLPDGKVLAPQGARYTSIELIRSANDLDGAFGNFWGKG